MSGLDELDGAEPDHELLRRAAGSAQSDDEIAPYRYGPAVSPHLAAEMAGEEIDPSGAASSAAQRAAKGADVLVAEGVGGFLVPLTGGYLVRDFARDLGLPVVIVASPGLGTINHTLLTVEAVRGAGLEVRAVVLNPWPAEPDAMELSNRDTIERTGRGKGGSAAAARSRRALTPGQRLTLLSENPAIAGFASTPAKSDPSIAGLLLGVIGGELARRELARGRGGRLGLRDRLRLALGLAAEQSRSRRSRRGRRRRW